jgi:hypothetical protein
VRRVFDDGIDLGTANVNAIELTTRHCRHARVDLVGGNSYVGSMLGLPMDLLEVRCEHAPPPRSQGSNALELAIGFYWENCPGCPHRDPSGLVPTLAAVAERRAAEEADRKAAADRAASERESRHGVRRERRRQLLAGEGCGFDHLAPRTTRRIETGGPMTRRFRCWARMLAELRLAFQV